MRVRDGVEADAAALASMTGRPEGVVRDMIHDRSVRVAVTDGADPAADADAGDDTAVDAVAGFVAFDVRDGVVHVTNVEGAPDPVERLFEEPVRFATREGMTVEAVLPADGTAADAAEAVGFEAVGSGPRIDGATTTRYRFDPEESG
ncbi:hypothetical protein DVK05_10905 [Halorubrum sp. Atlit-8R]|uniref:hypothetical protein n=1 Tax=unclassified Halorubrum TaxID=2642239 RepID=UPI000EF24C2E|nr:MULTISPECIES: hypothetical protein [unclassified Halorubrum]RLM68253.1 hypothetical protein DVK08_10970 [Halorubrum sp. Atlit-9R]RLM81484.1 hypothetical protein DVK05_10905 [Halorubrum sp. Atlit-8R]